LIRNSGTGSQREKRILEDTSVEVHDYLRKLSREENAKLLEDLKFRGMIYNDLPPEELTKIQERLKPVLDKFTKEVGEDLVKQTRVELEKVENRTRSLRGSSRPLLGVARAP
jgi:TRAP-type transport system periplasmic protein